MEPSLAISEMFKSIEGESSRAGLPCAFIRTVGCNLRCAYCDTQYARDGEGIRISVGEICTEVERFGTRLVCITGGEPLVQTHGVVALAEQLLAAGRTVLLETNGTIDMAPVPRAVVRIMDVKCPSSGESGKTVPANVEAIRPGDEVKFVISDRRDFDWAEAFLAQHWPHIERWEAGGPEVLFAPAHGALAPTKLAEWILEADLHVRLQLQLHRILWPERERGV